MYKPEHPEYVPIMFSLPVFRQRKELPSPQSHGVLMFTRGRKLNVDGVSSRENITFLEV